MILFDGEAETFSGALADTRVLQRDSWTAIRYVRCGGFIQLEVWVKGGDWEGQ